MKTLENRLAWLAGIIDGEGCVSMSIVRHGARRLDGTLGSTLRMRVSVANTDPLLIAEVRSIAEALGIGTLTHVCGGGLRGRKPVMHITFDQRKRVEAILKAVMPYMIAKRQRAEKALEIIRYWHTAKWVKGRKGAISPHDDAWLTGALGDLKHLNRRGPVETPTPVDPGF